MSNIIQELEAEQMNKEVPSFGPGDTVVVQVKVKEGDRVLFSSYAGTEVKIGGEDLLVMREEDIMGVIEA